jgi:hypothetical protein
MKPLLLTVDSEKQIYRFNSNQTIEILGSLMESNVAF